MEAFYGDRYFWSTAPDPNSEIRSLVLASGCSDVLLVIDENVPRSSLRPTEWAESIETYTLRDVRSVKTTRNVLAFIADNESRLHKWALVVAVGGGSLLDFVGLCCGLLYRGISYISVPTTTIAIADAAYGGKTAVNGGGMSKNQIGMYHHPIAVYSNPLFLATVPEDDRRSGIVEIVKLGLFFPEVSLPLQNAIDPDTGLADAARRAAHRKLSLLENDPFEESVGAPLLYGHPFSNAFETFCMDSNKSRPLLHGQAVSMGISFSSFLAEDTVRGQEGRFDVESAAVSRWLDMRNLVRDCTPREGAQLVSLMNRDKYGGREQFRIPCIAGRVGYTPIASAVVAQEFEKWRSWVTAG